MAIAFSTSSSVFIKNLSPLVKEDDIRETFRQCEGISAVTFKQFPGSTQRYCQVDFTSSGGVTNALQLNNAILLGVPMVITVIDPVSSSASGLGASLTGIGPSPGAGPAAAAVAAAAAANLLAGSGAASNIPTVTAPNLQTLLAQRGLNLPLPYKMSQTDLISQLSGIIGQRQETEEEQLARTVHLSGVPKSWDLPKIQQWMSSIRITTTVSDHREWEEDTNHKSMLIEVADRATATSLLQLPEGPRSVQCVSNVRPSSDERTAGASIGVGMPVNDSTSQHEQDSTRTAVMRILPAKATVSPRVPVNVSFSVPAAASLPVAYQQMGKLRLEGKLAKVRAMRDRLTQKLTSSNNVDNGSTNTATKPTHEDETEATDVTRTDDLADRDGSKNGESNDGRVSATRQRDRKVAPSRSRSMSRERNINRRRRDVSSGSATSSRAHSPIEHSRRRREPYSGRPWWLNHCRRPHVARGTHHDRRYVREREDRSSDDNSPRRRSSRRTRSPYRRRSRQRPSYSDKSDDGVPQDRDDRKYDHRRSYDEVRFSRKRSMQHRSSKLYHENGKNGISRGAQDEYHRVREDSVTSDVSSRSDVHGLGHRTTENSRRYQKRRRTTSQEPDSEKHSRRKHYSTSRSRSSYGKSSDPSPTRRHRDSAEENRARSQEPREPSKSSHLEDNKTDEVISCPRERGGPVSAARLRQMELYETYMDNE